MDKYLLIKVWSQIIEPEVMLGLTFHRKYDTM